MVPSDRPSTPRVRRRFPRWSEVRQTVQLRRPELHPVRRRLDRAVSIEDLRRAGRRVTPRAPFDYVDGAADDEISAARNRAEFAGLVFHPEPFRPVDHPETGVELAGRRLPLPLAFAPTGYTRMMHHHGETAVARVAEHHNIPYALSTVGTTSIEAVRRAVPDADLWFQLYPTVESDVTGHLVDRAAGAGYSTLIVTCDVAVAGNRRREDRSGLAIPPALRPSTLGDMARHPYWWVNKLTTPQLQMESLSELSGRYATRQVARAMFDPALSLETLDRIRRRWPGRLLVKGIVEPAAAAEVVEHGADGVILSNHGGRQLDRTPVPIAVLPTVRDRLGPDPTVLVDGGIRNGGDIVAARALGADAALIGRAYLYGLMAGGQDGVSRAYEILSAEYQRAMQLLGVRRSTDLAPRHVSLGSPTS